MMRVLAARDLTPADALNTVPIGIGIGVDDVTVRSNYFHPES
jgi:hypothetical protein